MLTVGLDSYVTVEEADAYVSSHFMSADGQRTAWENLSEADKEVALRNALQAMERIALQGRKKDSEQSLSFPRCYKNGYYYPLEWYEVTLYEDFMWHCQVDVPEDIKCAQIHEAVEIASPSKDTNDYDSLNGAVQSVSVTGMSESYKTAPIGLSATPETELRSKKAQKFIKVYTGGGYNVN